MSGLLAAAALLLLAAGLPKVVDPRAGAGALQAARLPLGGPGLVRLTGLGEAAVALVALAVGGRVGAALVAATYAVLAAFALRLARVAPDQPCACFGSRDSSPATGWHVGTDVALAAVGLAALVHPARGLLAETAAQPLLGLPFLAVVVALAWATYLLMTALPALLRQGAAA